MATDFKLFCRNATDSQLEAILEKEWEGKKYDEDRESDYEDAVSEAERRGWTVINGRRA